MTRVSKHVSAHSLVHLQGQTDTQSSMSLSVCVQWVAGRKVIAEPRGQCRFSDSCGQLARKTSGGASNSCRDYIVRRQIAAKYIHWTFPHLRNTHTHTAKVYNIIHEL